MSTNSAIEWTDATWNVITGCSKVSEGCRHCYAETVDRRFSEQWGHEFKPWTGPNAVHNIRFHQDRLTVPLHWRKPRRVFVNSLSDLFHEQVPVSFIADVFNVMADARCEKHTFQILTKRPERMLKVLTQELPEYVADHFPGDAPISTFLELDEVLPNVWLGVSVESASCR